MGLIQSIKSNKRKVALGVAGLAAGAAVAYGAKKLLGRGGKFQRKRRGSTAALRNRVQRLSLRIKERQLKRKLFKEDLRL